MPRLWGGLPGDYEMCGQCVGSGKIPSGLGELKCPRCDGLGRVRKRKRRATAAIDSSLSEAIGQGEPLASADFQQMYDRALAEANTAKDQVLAKLDEIHSELHPTRFGLLPRVEDNPEIEKMYSEMRAENRRLREWFDNVDPADGATARALEQLLAAWQGRANPLLRLMVERFQFACDRTSFCASMKR